MKTEKMIMLLLATMLFACGDAYDADANQDCNPLDDPIHRGYFKDYYAEHSQEIRTWYDKFEEQECTLVPADRPNIKDFNFQCICPVDVNVLD